MERFAGIVMIVLGGIFVAFSKRYAEFTYEKQKKLRKNIDEAKWKKRANLVAKMIGYGWIIIGGILLFQG